MSQRAQEWGDVSPQPLAADAASRRDGNGRVVLWTIAAAIGLLLIWVLLEGAIVYDRVQTLELISAHGFCDASPAARCDLPLLWLIGKVSGADVSFPDAVTLRYKPIDRELLVRIGRLHCVTALELNNAVVSPSDVGWVAAVDGLEMLTLEGDQITDASLDELNRLPNLRMLCLQRTRITDVGLSAISRLKHLEELFILSADVTDAGLLPLATMTGLKNLSLERTKTTATGAARLQAARPASTIEYRP